MRVFPAAFDLSAIGCDPALGRVKGDFAANVFAGVSGGIIYCDAWIARRPVEVFTRDIVTQYQRYKPDGVILESNAFQELIGPMILQECKARNISPLPLYQRPSHTKKEQRIHRLGAYLQQRLLAVRPNEGGRILVHQLQEFPLGEHDDGPDALEMAIRLLQELS